jgi:serine/threonine protein kinase
VDIGATVAEGLSAAHAQGITHRDLKPEHLFLTRDGRVKILDFGVARVSPPVSAEELDEALTVLHTEPGRVIGTVGYTSPAQADGEQAEALSDVSSFGCLLY